MAPLRLYIDGRTFRDQHNREVVLRGINIDATAKFPKTPNLPSYIPDEFYDGDNVSFVGRPFALEDAHTHFERLRRWGYNQIRYIFTWEAIEHAGPGKYDEDWIEFTIELLRSLKKYGFYIYMDPHQDVWSRHSGGSGAPMWTLYAAGFDPRNFNITQAALVQNTYPDPASFPKMIWSTNYTRLVCQTIFTLFWAGKDFAPKAIINGKNIQDFLQGHFIAAVKHLAKRIHEAGDLENEVVIGWESINEPNRGLVGYQDISVIPPEQQLQLGTSPTAFQGMLTGSGRACEITTWAFGNFGPRQTGRELVDPKGATVWLSSEYSDSKYGWKRDPQWKLGECLWAQHGVWDPATDTLLKKDYFAKDPKTGEQLDYDGFTNQYFLEHYRNYRDAIRSVHADAILFCQPPVMEIPPAIKDTADDDPNMVHAVHFYDGLTLMTKHWNRLYNVDVIGILRGKYLTPAFAIKVGETAIRNCLRDQLHFLRQESLDLMGNHPAVLTEIGIPYDMDDKHAYKTGDYSSQISAMDANHYAIEGSGMNGFSVWTYMAMNIHKWGDHWNGEDLSIYSLDDPELPTAKSLGQNSQNQSSTSLDRTSPAFSQSRTDSLSGSINPNNVKQALSTPSISVNPASDADPSSQPGYRAAEAYIRPSPVVVHGNLGGYGFNLQNCLFTMSLTSPTPTPENAPTVVYLPEFHYPSMHTDVAVSGGKWAIDTEEIGSGIVQYLKWWHAEGDQSIEIPGAKRKAGAIVDTSDDEAYLEQCRRDACILM
uniref:Cytoplasm protein n=1 Tax=Coccidioides posadasii RMSCC 3488 TaxID=454284 RepID=A0A0J6FJD1_COCPO|nr:cytoplasm protein [Coccidioides posadasii RMSCC 3488]